MDAELAGRHCVAEGAVGLRESDSVGELRETRVERRRARTVFERDDAGRVLVEAQPVILRLGRGGADAHGVEAYSVGHRRSVRQPETLGCQMLVAKRVCGTPATGSRRSTVAASSHSGRGRGMGPPLHGQAAP